MAPSTRNSRSRERRRRRRSRATSQATRLQADLGQLGIELREGEVQAQAARGGGFTLDGRVTSGKGQLEFQGAMSERGVVDVRIDGENFLAADIPAANVIVTPDLALTGDPKGYLLKGEVTIPGADINLQKLPQDEAPGVSPDVVVVRNGKVVASAGAGVGFPADGGGHREARRARSRSPVTGSMRR